jgi:glucose-1-phosphate cytidylyltransferase
MKVVILAGGVGSRLSEETEVRPKPMVEIGHRPILWHIMQHYAHFGFRDFIVCLGYKGEYVKKYFSESLALAADLTIDFAKGKVEMLETARDDWRVTLVDTGQTTETAGRLMRARKYLDPAEPFLMTYGDGVSDVDLHELVAFHRREGRLATITAVHPPARFGKLNIEGAAVTRFDEKPQMSEGWINGGFFVLEPGVFDYIPGDVDWAREPLEGLAQAGELSAYCHGGFWQCMDTMRDKVLLNSLWDAGEAPWKLWDS